MTLDGLNGILDAIEARVATALGLEASQVYESRSSGEASGNAAYVSATVPQMVPHTVCAERASVVVLIGFHLQEDGTPNRVQRMRHTMAIRSVLLDRSDPIPNAGLVKVTDFALSEPGDPDEGYLMGGLTLAFEAIVDKPE